MNFHLQPELQQLDESLERVLVKTYSFEQRNLKANQPNWQPEFWNKLADLGITLLGIPNEYGGFGESAVLHLPIMRAAGRTLWLEPYLATLVLAATAIRQVGTHAQKKHWLHGVAEGRLRLAWAHDEPLSEGKPIWTETVAVQHGKHWLLNGKKTLVLHAQTAQGLVVSARIHGTPDTPTGRRLFLVDPSAVGVTQRPYQLIDDTPASDMTFSGAAAELLGDDESICAEPTIQAVHHAGIAAVCADMLGSMEQAFQLTKTYINTRQQFGHAIAEYQAVRHRFADMAVSLELARSMAFAAAAAVDHKHTLDLLRAKVVIGRHARSLCHSAIQLHGGIGMTNEYPVGHYLRRVHVMDQLFGDTDFHLQALTHLTEQNLNSTTQITTLSTE